MYGGTIKVDQQGTKNDPAKDAGDNEVSPTEELREEGETRELSVPGSQNPASEVKDEEKPNTE
jgi:hypothetical protein